MTVGVMTVLPTYRFLKLETQDIMSFGHAQIESSRARGRVGRARLRRRRVLVGVIVIFDVGVAASSHFTELLRGNGDSVNNGLGNDGQSSHLDDVCSGECVLVFSKESRDGRVRNDDGFCRKEMMCARRERREKGENKRDKSQEISHTDCCLICGIFFGPDERESGVDGTIWHDGERWAPIPYILLPGKAVETSIHRIMPAIILTLFRRKVPLSLLLLCWRSAVSIDG